MLTFKQFLAEQQPLQEGMLSKFTKICNAEAAKMLGVEKVRCVYSDSPAWDRYDRLSSDGRARAGAEKTISPDDFGLGGDDDDDEIEADGRESFTVYSVGGVKFVKGEWNDYGGGDDPHFYVPVGVKAK